VPVAFTSWIHFLHAKKRAKREHRTVCLPDYQGVGIGNALSDYLAAAIKGLGFDAISTTGNPAMIQSRNRSDKWKMKKAPSRNSAGGKYKRDSIGKTFAVRRLTAAFEYVGKPMDAIEARKLWGI
jgi:hypothetical protein